MFEFKNAAEIEAMDDATKVTYYREAQAALKAMADENGKDLGLAKDEIAELKNQVSKFDFSTITSMVEAIKTQGQVIEDIQKNGIGSNGKMENGLRKYIRENSEVLKKIKAGNQENFEFTLKGTQAASDINSGSDEALVLAGTVRKPVRATRIMDLFTRKPVSKEYLKYREENVVTRDAKFVVACATSTHTTKKSWIYRTVELAKIRDIVEACMDMLDDYVWVEAELKELIEESIKLKADYELLLGSGVNPTDMLSIDTISSEFNAANVLAPFTGKFQSANLEQLADAMAGQISVFGQENSWMADTVVMNFTDFVVYRNLKDANGNKLIHTLSDAVATIAGMRVITSPIVAPNTMFVFDSTKGEILDREMLTVKTSYENNDNIEHEMVTFVAVERLQFHVPTIERDAFMKCSDVATAIIAITKT